MFEQSALCGARLGISVKVRPAKHTIFTVMGDKDRKIPPPDDSPDATITISLVFNPF